MNCAHKYSCISILLYNIIVSDYFFLVWGFSSYGSTLYIYCWSGIKHQSRSAVYQFLIHVQVLLCTTQRQRILLIYCDQFQCLETMHYCSFARTHIGPGPQRHDGKQWKLLTESGAHWRLQMFLLEQKKMNVAKILNHTFLF